MVNTFCDIHMVQLLYDWLAIPHSVSVPYFVPVITRQLWLLTHKQSL